MTEQPLTPPPQFPPGSPELAEWEAIAAAPGGHTQLPQLAPDDPAHLGELEAHGFELADLGVPDEHTRTLSNSGVLFGPDCSQYQGKPDWYSVRTSGCVIGGYKVSEGRTFEDPSHRWNREHTKAAGLVPLAYHYLYYSDEYGNNPSLWGRQADWFVDNADPAAIHVLDVEAAATPGHHLGVKEWVAQYRKRLPGHPLGVYANRSLWQNRSRMPYDPGGLFDFLWHAGVGNGYYTSARGTIQEEWSTQRSLVNSFASNGFPTCKLWQITDHARVPGVGGSFCDGNAFQGTITELRALATGKADDSMSAEDVAALKTFIDGKLDDIAAAVWSRHLATDWDGQPSAAGDILASAQRYAIEAGYSGVRPKGNGAAGTPTLAAQLLAVLKTTAGQTDTLEASEAAQSQALASLNPAALADAIVGKLGGSTDAALVKAAVAEALAEQLPGVHLAVDPPR
jgi:hypothetical protein